MDDFTNDLQCDEFVDERFDAREYDDAFADDLETCDYEYRDEDGIANDWSDDMRWDDSDY